MALVRARQNRGGPRPAQLRQQVFVELSPEVRILLGRPFVEQQDGSLFQQAYNERQTPALAGRKVERGKLAVHDASLPIQPEIGQQPVESRRIRLGYPVEPVEKMIVGEY